MAGSMRSVQSCSRSGIKSGSTFVAAALLIFVAGCGGPPSAPLTVAVRQASAAPPAVEHLLRLMRDRLALMHDVGMGLTNFPSDLGHETASSVLPSYLKLLGALPSAVKLDFGNQRAVAKSAMTAARTCSGNVAHDEHRQARSRSAGWGASGGANGAITLTQIAYPQLLADGVMRRRSPGVPLFPSPISSSITNSRALSGALKVPSRAWFANEMV